MNYLTQKINIVKNSKSLLGCPFIKPVIFDGLNLSDSASFCSPKHTDILSVSPAYLIVDKCIVTGQVLIWYVTAEEVFVVDIEIFEELREGTFDPLILFVGQSEHV